MNLFDRLMRDAMLIHKTPNIDEWYTWTLDEILTTKLHISGLYALMDNGGNIIYIGQSENITKRVYRHADSKNFLCVLILQIDNKYDRLLLEKYYIVKHQPTGNLNEKNKGTITYHLHSYKL